MFFIKKIVSKFFLVILDTFQSDSHTSFTRELKNEDYFYVIYICICIYLRYLQRGIHCIIRIRFQYERKRYNVDGTFWHLTEILADCHGPIKMKG